MEGTMTFTRRTAASIVAASLALTLVPTATFADPQETQGVDRAAVQAAQARLEALGGELVSLNAELEEASTELERTDNLIDRTEQQKKATESQLADAKDLLSARLRSSYKAGGFDPIEFLFGASDLEDLISRFYYMDKIARSDAEAISAVNDLADELRAQERELERSRSDQLARIDEIEVRVAAQEGIISEARDYYNALDAELQAELARQAAEAERRAAEQAQQEREAQERAAQEHAAQAQSASAAAASGSTEQDDASATQGQATSEESVQAVLDAIAAPAEEPARPAAEPAEQDESAGDQNSQDQDKDTENSDADTDASDPEPVTEQEEPEATAETSQAGSEEPGESAPAQTPDEPFPGGGLASAYACLGYPYVWGGYLPSQGGFDCSGLVSYCYGDGSWRRGCESMALAIMNAGLWKSSIDELVPGDILFTDSEFNHVQIYIGGGQVIHAPYPGRVVCIDDIYAFYGGGPFVRP